jgi:hypothetical protein
MKWKRRGNKILFNNMNRVVNFQMINHQAVDIVNYRHRHQYQVCVHKSECNYYIVSMKYNKNHQIFLIYYISIYFITEIFNIHVSKA